MRSRGSSAGLPRRRGGELRRALRDQAVPLADEGAVLELARNDHLTAIAERIGDRPGVGDRDRVGPVAIRDPEVELVTGVVNRAGDDVPGQLIGPGRVALQQLRGLLRLGRGGEGRVDEAGGQKNGGRQRDDQSNLALARWIHGDRELSQPLVKGGLRTRALVHYLTLVLPCGAASDASVRSHASWRRWNQS